MRLCIHTQLEQDTPVYVQRSYLPNWTQIKFAKWLQREAAKKSKNHKNKKYSKQWEVYSHLLRKFPKTLFEKMKNSRSRGGTIF